METHEESWKPGESLWSSDLKLGIPVIDRQHHQLVNKLEELLTVIHQGKDYKQIRGLAAFLQRYTLEHFQTEEGYMRKFKYPQVAEHTLTHNAFQDSVVKVKEFVQTHPTSQEAIQIVESTMLRWYVEHITSMDQEFARFLRENDLLEEVL